MTIEKNHRSIRSYAIRSGRLTKGQTLAFTQYWAEYGIDIDNQCLDLHAIFANQNPIYLEVGFGNGHSLAQMASQRPQDNFIGIEVHKPGVGHLLMEAHQLELTNLRLIHYDAVEIFKKIKTDSLKGLMLFFPDPWHKRKHQKRRILTSEFIQQVIRMLKPKGTFHLATDWQHYAQQMLKMLEQVNAFENLAGKNQYYPRPDFRPLTKFEQRGQNLGHQVWDLIYQKK